MTREEALEQQPCEDCISRQAVLDQAVDYGSNTYLIPVNSVKTLPSVTPKEKTGWIPVSERLPEEFESVLVCYESQGGMAQAVSERFGTYTGYRWSALAGIEPIAWMPLPEPYELQESEENQKLGIDLGDEVIGDYGAKGVVVGMDTYKGEGWLSLLMRNHKVPQLVKASGYKTKTGRHFPQIIEVLEQIKGETDGK